MFGRLGQEHFVNGPFWKARIRLVRIADPVENFALRNLFLENTLKRARAGDEEYPNLFLPGTMLILCRISEVVLWLRGSSPLPIPVEGEPPERDQFRWTNSEVFDDQGVEAAELTRLRQELALGKLSLLLVEVAPDAWNLIDSLEFTCLGGEIDLQPLTSDGNDLERLYAMLRLARSDPESPLLPRQVSLHASGLSIYGKTTLPWEAKTEFTAPFQLARVVEKGEGTRDFRLTVELERLLEEERSALIKVTRNLNAAINPADPRTAPSRDAVAPRWVTLGIVQPGEVLRFARIFDFEEGEDLFQIERGQLELTISDQQPSDQQYPPTSLAHLLLPAVELVLKPGGKELKIVVSEGGQPVGLIANIPDILFDFGRDELRKAGKEVLLGISEVLKRRPELKVQINGHTDSIGSERFNQGLSERRAAAVEKFLVGSGNLDPDRITRQGFGELRPIASNETPEGRQKNRRVEIVVSDESSGAGTLFYHAKRNELPSWREDVTLVDISLAFSPIEIPRLLRDAQDLPAPIWIRPSPEDEKKVLRPQMEVPLLYGYFPLEDGLAILPVPNLTEQIYLDLDLLERPIFGDATVPPVAPPLISGAAVFGNSAVLDAFTNEQPWSMTLLDAGAVKGTWTLFLDGSRQFILTDVLLNLDQPEVVLDGLLWLCTDAPSVEDALPDLDDWIAGARSLTLRSMNAELEVFPPLIKIGLSKLHFANREEVAEVKVIPAPALGKWKVTYTADKAVFSKMVSQELLLDDTFRAYPPLIWRRHPTLPMIQALPMTQSKLPPNYPARSRQLAPFEVPTREGAAGLLPDLEFGADIEPGAEAWPRLLSPCEPAREWKSQPDLPFVALSIPGVYFDPRLRIAEPEGWIGRVCYRFDLPYCDEVNALAQMPKIKPPPEELSPLPDSPPPLPAKPIGRIGFAEHWQDLSERASLASADSVSAFEKDDAGSIRHLIDPFKWPVKVEVKFDEYPGRLVFTDAISDPAAQIVLTSEAALGGISGNFAKISAEKIRLLSKDEPAAKAFAIVAGAMAAHAESSGFVDQRGLVRRATSKGAILRTKVEFDDKSHELTTALAPVSLSVPGGSDWLLWFRDLPVGTNQTFKPLEREIDVNDPKALSPGRDYLSGFEWRLAGDPAHRAETEFLQLFHLEFHPLSLERVVLGEDAVQLVEIVGRLQLPVEGAQELNQFPNAVRLVFDADSAGALRLNEVSAQSEGVWPLAIAKGEAANAPTLEWNTVKLESERLKFSASLNFILFDEDWSIPLDELSFGATGDVTARSRPFGPSDTITPTGLTLTIQPKEKKYTATLEVIVALGEARAFEARIGFQIAPAARDVKVLRASLFQDLSVEGCTCVLSDGALQFSWKKYASSEVDLQMLPGMHFRADETRSAGPGYATITFRAVGAGVLQLIPESAFLEAIFLCRWGEFLSGDPPTRTATKGQVFGSSAGDLAFGYTTQRTVDGKWDTSLLVNGMLEVKSLVSWPKALNADRDRLTLVLPALNPGANPPRLDHLRHTLRILFNQHTIPPGTLRLDRESGAKLLFNLAKGKSWQFLAVVEHQLIDVLDAGGDFSEIRLEGHRRWTAVQEVRLTSPATFKDFLKKSTFATQTERLFMGFIDPIEGVSREDDRVPRRLKQGYLALEFQRLLNGSDGHGLDGLTAPTLIVEASAVHWIKQELLAPATATSLQFLPNGTQSAVLSNPQDFAPGTKHDSGWLLLTDQFLGRLQDEKLDGLDASETNCELQIDPVLRLVRDRVRASEFPISLGFSSWALTLPLKLKVSAFDWDVGRVFLRLDPNSLEENWFRMGNPLREDDPPAIGSIMAARPDSPARLSRSVALRYAFDSIRQFYPPGREPLYQPPDDFPGDRLVWRRDSLLVPQAVALAPASDSTTTSVVRYPWAVEGLQIITAPWFQSSEGILPRIHAAVTLIPALLKIGPGNEAIQNPMPLSIVASPYIALSFAPAPEDISNFASAIVYAELLCIDSLAKRLLPVATRLFEKDGNETEDALRARYRQWASQTHSALAPRSPVAILRRREILRQKEGTAGAKGAESFIEFAFEVVRGVGEFSKISKRAFPMRAPVQTLKFREGQFGGFEIPLEIENFELAPPLVTGVQPFRLEERPGPTPKQPWPWGVSGVSISLQFTGEKRGVIGEEVKETEEVVNPFRLWWQAPQQFLQYRSPSTPDAPAAGLPKTFRAPAIKCLLPTLPDPPMPAIDKAIIEKLFLHWQPILPGALRYLVIGSRSGAFLAFRNQLLTQTCRPTADRHPTTTVVSGSLPVQHRAPRPVSLPANGNQPREKMLQTWGSFFQPSELLIQSSSPIDEAFYAETVVVIPEAPGQDPKTKTYPAMRVKLELRAPEFGGIPPDWNGDLICDLTIEPGSDKRHSDHAVCNLSFEIVSGAQTIRYDSLPERDSKTIRVELTPQFKRDSLKDMLKRTQAGQELKLLARIKLSATEDSELPTYYPILSFTLRKLDPDTLRLPLRPVFLQFEDSQYNVQLASQPARTARLVKLPGRRDLCSVLIATDRREYNADGDVALLFHSDPPLSDGLSATLKISRFTRERVAEELSWPLTDKQLKPDALYRFSLPDLRKKNGEPASLVSGEIIQLQLEISKTDLSEVAKVTLKVNIVVDPVVPPTEAAYALLRISETSGSNGGPLVECARFAWAPTATRIDLINPIDLRGELVRRRAVFQWSDSVRSHVQRFDLNEETLAALAQKEVSPPVLEILQRLAGTTSGITFIGKEPFLAAIQAKMGQSVSSEDQLKLQSEAVIVGPKCKYVVQKITANGSTHFPT